MNRKEETIVKEAKGTIGEELIRLGVVIASSGVTTLRLQFDFWIRLEWFLQRTVLLLTAKINKELVRVSMQYKRGQMP